MRTPSRYALALAAGLVAAGASVFLADGAVDPFRTWLAAGLNAVVWSGFVALYMPIYDRFDGAPGNGDRASQYDAMKLGGTAGVASSVGIVGVPLLLIDVVPGGFVAALGLLTFGLVLFGMAVGMGAVATNVPDDRPGESVDSAAAGASSAAGD